MLLDTGICTIYAAENGAPAGNKPVDQLIQKHQSWYGELDFASDPITVTDFREDVETSGRIRILQNRAITTRDVAVLSIEPDERYEITRTFNGTDDASGALITDLSLRRVN